MLPLIESCLPGAVLMVVLLAKQMAGDRVRAHLHGDRQPPLGPAKVKVPPLPAAIV